MYLIKIGAFSIRKFKLVPIHKAAAGSFQTQKRLLIGWPPTVFEPLMTLCVWFCLTLIQSFGSFLSISTLSVIKPSIWIHVIFIFFLAAHLDSYTCPISPQPPFSSLISSFYSTAPEFTILINFLVRLSQS